MSDRIAVREFSDYQEACNAAVVLDDAGIDSMVHEEQGGVFTHIYVNKEDQAKADELLGAAGRPCEPND